MLKPTRLRVFHPLAGNVICSSARFSACRPLSFGTLLVVTRSSRPEWRSVERSATLGGGAEALGQSGLTLRRAFSALGSRREEQKPPTPTPEKPKLRDQLREKLKAVQTHENIYTLPNFLTVTRLIAAPVCGYLVLHDQHLYAVGLFAYAGITDLLDGWIARKWNLQSVVGSVIDPMADKMLMTVLVGCLAANGALPLPIATLILGRDISLAIAAIYYRWASLPAPKTFTRYWDFSLPSASVHPTTVSKFNTFLQLLLIGYTLSLPLLPAPEAIASTANLGEVADAMGGVSDSWDGFTKAFQATVAATTTWSGLEYAFNKSAVKILGEDEALKRKQGFRGRAIIGVSFSAVVALAGWLWLNGKGVKKGEKAEQGLEEKK